MARDRSNDYAKRDTLAKSQGFRSYQQKRKALDYARRGPLAGYFADVTGLETINARNPKHVELVKWFYFGYALEPDNYELDGPKMKWETAAFEFNGESAIDNLSAHARWLWEWSQIK